MINQNNVWFKIFSIIFLSIILLLCSIGKAYCNKYLDMSRLELIRTIYDLKKEVIDLERELNEKDELIINEKERNILLIEQLKNYKKELMECLAPTKKELQWYHFYTTVNYITDIKDHGINTELGMLLGGWYNFFGNIGCIYNYIEQHEFRLKLGLTLWY